MGEYFWDDRKDQRLRKDRGVSFEDVRKAIEEDRLLDVLVHPNQKKYPGQKIYVVELNGYAYHTPFIESADGVVLKTVIPSRKSTKKYLKGAREHGEAERE